MSSGIINNLLSLKTSLLFVSTRLCEQLRLKHCQTKYLYNMNEAYLRYENGADTFQFTFRYMNPDLNVDRQFNMIRKPAEPVSTFLKRLDSNLSSVIDKKKRKKAKKSKEPIEESIKIDNVQAGMISLKRKNNKIELDVLCKTLLENPSDVTLHVFGTPYQLKVNVPWVTNMGLPDSILAGFPTYPSEFEAMNVDKNKSVFTWYRNFTEKSLNLAHYETAWEEISNGFLYTPTTEDINATLKLRCVPMNEDQTGPMIETESTAKVEAGPGACPFEVRHAFTQDKLSGKNFRVTSYNILADVYASTDYSRDVLFSYCPPYALQIDYRKQLIAKELIGYNSDIICLQEVDRKVFETDLFPILSSLHYNGIFKRKGIDLSEGIATFWDARRFDEIRSESRVISQNVNSMKFRCVWEKVGNEKAKERFLARNTTVQITVLRSKEISSEVLVVGNTHLYFQPNADHIRLLQGFYALMYCQEIAAEVREQFKAEGINVSIVLCGDFNSTPDSGIYQLMTTNFVAENHKDWSSTAEESIDNVSLSHDSSFASACGTPPYTNFTVDFADCLDYIYYETMGLDVIQVVPLPSKEELALNGAIPSIVFPSDHIALCADLRWTK